MPDLSKIGTAMFWSGVLWVAYVFVGYPAILWLWGRIRPFRAASGSGLLPSVSVLLSVRNEEKDIAWKLRETLDWDYPADRLEVLVASDASTDRTDEIVASLGNPRVRLVRMEQRGGKVRALNHLAQLSRADLLFYTDANARIGSQVMRVMAGHFADPRVGCVTGRTQSAGAAASEVAAGARVYWNYESVVASLESRLGAVLVCDGAIHCARRAAVVPLSPDLANDLELPVRIRAQGYRNTFEPRAVATEDETQSPREEYTRRRRICGQGALGLWRLRLLFDGLGLWQFISRKVLRWLIAIPLVLILGGSALSVREPFFAGCLVIQAAFYSMALAALVLRPELPSVVRLVAVPMYVVLGAAGALRGALDTLRGRRFDIWEVAALSRGRH